MISNITSPSGGAQTEAAGIRGQEFQHRAAQQRMAATRTEAPAGGGDLAAEHQLFDLARREFEAMMPAIEALSSDIS